MTKPQVDVAQLVQKDPATWTAVLRHHLAEAEVRVTVTAVASQPVLNREALPYSPHLLRYTLFLEGHRDPITCIAKRAHLNEALFYRDLAPELDLAPTCWFNALGAPENAAGVPDDASGAPDTWLILADVPDDIPPARWRAGDALEVMQQLARLHAAHWDDRALPIHHPWLPHYVGEKRPYTLPQLREQHSRYFSEGPAANLSEHALQQAGRLAPRFLQAANGLAVMRSLGGWPGILGESHLSAAADLLDDPVPVFDRLRDLPPALLHGSLQNTHWRVPLWGSPRLLDWREVCIGPCVLDVVAFVEQFDVLYDPELPWHVAQRNASAITEEMLVDGYIMAMRARLGAQSARRPAFNARAFRQAIPAARCLHVLLTWFPLFATWFGEMPNAYTWQKVNRMPDRELVGTRFEAIIGYRAYLPQVFGRFLQAYRAL